ncbi:hypothetical protein [Nonomuraea angiospora]|uniref:hypothetical protein n=1 Tax=Nonomuraea angiospora TaxID=46172 RepID=UPI0029B854F5|nr:hypothetical protein [Nonomuraea angiospora]MDX3109718.1 hypothetical protein [Nonomuraea angiospora]
MTSIRAELRGRTPVHDMLSVWAGPDAEHPAHCGDLYMRTEEAAELIARIEAGEAAPCPPASVIDRQELVEVVERFFQKLGFAAPETWPERLEMFKEQLLALGAAPAGGAS